MLLSSLEQHLNHPCSPVQAPGQNLFPIDGNKCGAGSEWTFSGNLRDIGLAAPCPPSARVGGESEQGGEAAVGGPAQRGGLPRVCLQTLSENSPSTLQ